MRDVLRGWCVLVAFCGYAVRRAFFIQRTMTRLVSFEDMLMRLCPVERHTGRPPDVPGGSIFRVADWCAYVFPWLWRRRCLFRSLLVLDWAHRMGIDPTLNVGMELGLNREQGHCWLSIGGEVFCEPGGWPARYRTLFYRGHRLQHWTSLAPEVAAAEGQKRGL
jgi:hypothetical protein